MSKFEKNKCNTCIMICNIQYQEGCNDVYTPTTWMLRIIELEQQLAKVVFDDDGEPAHVLTSEGWVNVSGVVSHHIKMKKLEDDLVTALTRNGKVIAMENHPRSQPIKNAVDDPEPFWVKDNQWP